MSEKQAEYGIEKTQQGSTEKKDIRSLLSGDGAKRQLSLALPRHLTPERFSRIALTALNKTPKLLECTVDSLWACVLDLAQLGLEPDGRKAHIIPYGKVATLLIDYKGLVELARRSGEIADIHADVVCANDAFDYSFGSDAKLVHKPNLTDRGTVIAAYSFVRLKDGATSYEVMNIDEIDAIRKRSKAGGSGPWMTDWNEMAKKTVFRRHSKWLPLSSEFQEAVEKDIDTPAFSPAKLTAEIEMPKPKKPIIETTAKPEADPIPSGELSDEEKSMIEKAELEMEEKRKAKK